MNLKIAGIIALGVLLLALFQNTQISLNKSGSLPSKAFISLKSYSYEKGDLVLIKGHEVKYVGNMSLIKRVVGVEGDEVAPLLDKLKPKTKAGKTLTPLKVKVIPKGFVFVNTDHPDSFDSRYEEFGLVKTQEIYGRAFPIW